MAITQTSKDKTKGRRFLGCFFTIFLLIGLGTSAALLYPLVQIARARNWREVPCTILTSEVESHSSSKGGPTYSIAVTYEYELEDQRHVGSRYKFAGGSSSGYDGKKAIVDRLSPGTKTFCYVNRRDPGDAVIERGFTGDILFGFFPLIFAVIGAGGLFGVFVYKGKAPPPGAVPGLPAAAATAKGATGVMPLKASTSPLMRFGCASIFALIWNGIVSIFVMENVSKWRSGHVDGCGSLFMIPFVLVGLGVGILAIYYFLSIFNPKPVLKLSSSTIALGDSVELAWDTAGNVDRVTSFSITLEGREEATYRRGTSTSTDKATFAVVPLAESNRGKDLRRGKAVFTVPPDSMHSFKSSNNKIVWTIQVKGDIPRWPDIGEEYPVEVLPLRNPTGGAA